MRRRIALALMLVLLGQVALLCLPGIERQHTLDTGEEILLVLDTDQPVKRVDADGIWVNYQELSFRSTSASDQAYLEPGKTLYLLISNLGGYAVVDAWSTTMPSDPRQLYLTAAVEQNVTRSQQSQAGDLAVLRTEYVVRCSIGAQLVSCTLAQARAYQAQIEQAAGLCYGRVFVKNGNSVCAELCFS